MIHSFFEVIKLTFYNELHSCNCISLSTSRINDEEFINEERLLLMSGSITQCGITFNDLLCILFGLNGIKCKHINSCGQSDVDSELTCNNRLSIIIFIKLSLERNLKDHASSNWLVIFEFQIFSNMFTFLLIGLL